MVALIEDPGEQNGDPTHQEDSLEAPHPEQNTVLPRAPLLGSPSYLSRILDLFLYNLCLAAPEQINNNPLSITMKQFFQIPNDQLSLCRSVASASPCWLASSQ